MNKEGLIKELSKRNNKTQFENAIALTEVIDTVIDILASGDKIIIQGFGKFTPVKRSARNTTNPQTHEIIEIAEYNTISFKAGKTLKEKVNEIQL